MNQVQTFNHPMFGELPVVIIDGVEWFGATEAAKALSFSNPRAAIDNHVETEDVTVHDTLTNGGKQKKKHVNESGLYDLIFGAAKQGNNPAIRARAKAFKRWVTAEVLPMIRKHGAYMTPKTIDNIINDPDFGIKLLTTLKKEREEKKALMLENAEKDKLIEEYEPKAKYVDQILQSTDTVTITQIAKDYGMSGQVLNKILYEEKVQYKQNNQWLLYAKHHNKGYTKSQTIDVVHSDGARSIKLNTRWTQKGRLFIHELLEKRGIVAVVDRKSKEVAK